MRLVVKGAPRTKKTSQRVLRFGKFNKIVPSAAFIAFQDAAVPQLQSAWSGRAPIDRPVAVRAMFYRDALRGDAAGYYQGIADILQRAGVLVDDKLVAHWDGSRLLKDASDPRIELEITEIGTAGA